MADTPVPPTPPTPPTTPPPPPPAAPREENDLSELSPFKVLQKKGASASLPIPPSSAPAPSPTPPPAPATPPPPPPTPFPASSFQAPKPAADLPKAEPAKKEEPPEPPKPVPPPTSTIDRDELLKLASQAPAESFVLPSPDQLPTEASGKIQSMLAEEPLPIPPAPPKLPLEPQPVAPPPPPRPMPPKPLPPKPLVPPLAAPPKPAAAPVPNSNPTPAPLVPAQPTKGLPPRAMPRSFSMKPRLNIGLISGIGLAVVLVVMLGAGYILAVNGTRVPIFYTMVSGLKGDAHAAAADSVAFVKSQTGYTFASETSLAPQSSTGQTTVPDNTADAGAQVYTLHALSSLSQYGSKGATYLGKEDLTINSGTAIPLTLQAPSGTDSKWSVFFNEGATQNIVVTPSSDLQQTLLFPVLKPLSLETVLSAVKATRSYQKRQSAGKTVTAYSVTYDPAVLKDSFPQQATLSNLDGVVELTWKNGSQPANQPVKLLIRGNLAYKDKSYQFNQVWNLTAFNATLDTGKYPELAKVNDQSQIDATTPISVPEFIAQLGIGKLSYLPNTLQQTDGGVSTNTAAVTPAGESISELGETITTNPPLPDDPATDAAKKRDTQRKQDLALLKSALEKYKTDNGQYPVSSGIEQTISSKVLFDALVPKYLTKMPVDPLPSTYWYEVESTATSYSIRAVAEDKTDTEAKQGSVYAYFEVTN